MNRGLQGVLAKVRRKEQHQQPSVNWLLPADQSPLETTIAYEQVAVEVTAALISIGIRLYRIDCRASMPTPSRKGTSISCRQTDG
jgi:hypothetical protein